MNKHKFNGHPSETRLDKRDNLSTLINFVFRTPVKHSTIPEYNQQI